MRTIQENIQFLDRFTQGECDGFCDEKYPYRRCIKHTAIDALNEASEILFKAVSDIEERASKEHDT